jgi:hypothetical protein
MKLVRLIEMCWNEAYSKVWWWWLLPVAAVVRGNQQPNKIWSVVEGCYFPHSQRFNLIRCCRKHKANMCSEFGWSVALSPIHSYSLCSAITITQSAVHWTHRVLFVCCPSSRRVPASHGGCSPSWVPELSPSHSHSNTWHTVHSLEIPLEALSYNYFTGTLRTMALQTTA